MRVRIVAGNWKMYKTPSEAEVLAKALLEKIGTPACEVVVCPTAVALDRVGRLLDGSPIRLGAQNCGWAREGAFTGELAPPMLREVGVRYVVLGHSERRQFFGETDEGVNRRARAALADGLRPILCVGELLAEREAGRTQEVVARQTRAALEGLTAADLADCVIAYEPVWAIGTGRVATPEQAQEVHAYIRSLVAEHAGAEAAAGIRIQYGGSVKADNAAGLFAMPDIDGALVGGASLEAGSFAGIVAAAG